MITQPDLLYAVLSAAGHFAADALSTLDSDLAVRLAPHAGVVIVTADHHPLARLIAAAPGGELRVLYSAVPSADLGVASARAIEAAVAQLPDATRSSVATIITSGRGRLALCIDRDLSAVALFLDSGDTEPITLAQLVAADPAVMH